MFSARRVNHQHSPKISKLHTLPVQLEELAVELVVIDELLAIPVRDSVLEGLLGSEVMILELVGVTDAAELDSVVKTPAADEVLVPLRRYFS